MICRDCLLEMSTVPCAICTAINQAKLKNLDTYEDVVLQYERMSKDERFSPEDDD